MVYAATYEQLEKVIEGTEICIYGAGRNLHHFLQFVDVHVLSPIVSCVIDAASDKQGTSIIYKNQTISIVSPEFFFEHYNKKWTIIVTNKDYLEIVGKIVEQLPEATVFLWSLCEYAKENEEIKEKRCSALLYPSKNVRIPKTIHYCWFGGKEIPEENKRIMESWKKYCSDYEIIRWDESNFDIDKCAFSSDAYKKGKYAFVSDFARLDVVAEHGGIYLDVDVELVKPLDDLLGFDAYAGMEYGNRVALGLGFGAIKGLDIIRELRDDYYDITFPVNDNYDNVTCPIIQTKHLQEKGYLTNGKCQVIDNMTLLPQVYLCGMDYRTLIIDVRDCTFSIHHYSASWVSKNANDQKINKKEIASYIKVFNG